MWIRKLLPWLPEWRERGDAWAPAWSKTCDARGIVCVCVGGWTGEVGDPDPQKADPAQRSWEPG